jgi:SAM-dependent methyltransferase
VSCYLHGTEPSEQDRLSRLNDLLNGLSLRELSLVGGEKVIDIGSGLGQLSRTIARTVGVKGAVVGVERSSEQLAQANQLALEAGEEGLVKFRHGEADQLPLEPNEWASFDVAHARYLLEHVPDPLVVVREMVRSVRPGGRIVLEDDAHDTHRLWPEPPGFNRVWATYLRMYDRVGNDPFVGHRLVSLLVQAGALPTRNTWLFFGACAGQPQLLAAFVENLIGVLHGVREPILSLGEIEPSAFDSCLKAIRVWGHRPDAAYWYAISWAEGRRPSEGEN